MQSVFRLTQHWIVCHSLVLTFSSVAVAQTVRRVSLRTGGLVEGNGNSHIGSATDAAKVISDDGRWVVFWSDASNLVSSDINTCPSAPTINVPDVFVHDLQSASTKLLSAATGGAAGDLESWRPSISGEYQPLSGPLENGRYVVFQSQATNLDTLWNDTNGVQDIFVVDRDTDATGPDGIYDEAGAVKTSRVSFGLTNPGARTGRVEANGGSANPTISRDGRFVAFESDATNLVPGDANGVQDVFMIDRDVDGDGLYDETASLPGGVWDFMIWRASAPEAGMPDSPPPPPPQNAGRRTASIRATGRFVVFQSFWPLDPFDTDASNAWDVYMFDRLATDPTRPLAIVSQTSGNPGVKGNQSSRSPYIANTFVAFESQATNFPGAGNNLRLIYVRNQGPNTLSPRLSENDNGQLPVAGNGPCSNGGMEDAHCLDPSMSAEGRFVAFHSKAVNLIVGPTETTLGVDLFATTTPFSPCLIQSVPPICNAYDVFLRDRDYDCDGVLDSPAGAGGSHIVRVSSSVVNTGHEGNNSSIYPSVSKDGRYVVFESLASDLVTTGPADTNSKWDVFVWDRPVVTCPGGSMLSSLSGESDDSD